MLNYLFFVGYLQKRTLFGPAGIQSLVEQTVIDRSPGMGAFGRGPDLGVGDRSAVPALPFTDRRPAGGKNDAFPPDDSAAAA